ncbi:LPXTG cell wall anchor domain-containing protein [Apilactobacillus kunkeei]|uniref:Gram-positive cocci surface proteins LPxTG domain-containing protein n=1 Tax=Apilactobacillus kunkeei TaxID=148814 RepID=A0A0M9DEE8_9LACO|nr:LPXTG cell wall anchor domain-containing protein [Apilactobacillus kunkeei]KOY79762.1 hypothetical protein RZ72_06580 [Apilactobacillus kunkeei]
MKQYFDRNNKYSSKSKISKKWIYAAAVTGVLITGAKAAQNTDNGPIDAKASLKETKKVTYPNNATVNIKYTDENGNSNYVSSVGYQVNLTTVNGKKVYDLTTLKKSQGSFVDVSSIPDYLDPSVVSKTTDAAANADYLYNSITVKAKKTQAAQQDNSANQNSASSSNNGSSSAGNNSSAQSSSSNSNSGAVSSNGSSAPNTNKQVTVTVHSKYNANDTGSLTVYPNGRSVVYLADRTVEPNLGMSIYDYLTKLWNADPSSLPDHIDLTQPTVDFTDSHKLYDKTIQFVDNDGKGNVVSSTVLQGANDHEMDISSAIAAFKKASPNAVVDPKTDIYSYYTNGIVSKSANSESEGQVYTFNVYYPKVLTIVDDNNKPTGQTAKLISKSSTMSSNSLKSLLTGQGFQLVNPDDVSGSVDFTNGVGYNIKLIKNSLPISFVDQHGNVVYSTNLPSSAINQPVSIKDALDTVTNKGVTPDSSNSIVKNQAVPAFYKDQSVKINVTAPVSNLKINFVDKSTGEIVDSLQKDNVTDFDNISIADKINSLKSQNYAPELSELSSQFNSQTYDNFQAQYVLNPAIQDDGNGNHVATIYVDSTVATPANTNKTGEGYAMKFKDANGNPISLTVNSANPTIAPKELQKALADQGYTLSQDDINKLGDTPVDLTQNNGDTGLKIAPNTTSSNVYPKTVSFTDANGNPKTATVNIKSDSPTMNINDLARALADQGYTLTDAEKDKLGQNANLGSTDPIEVTPNANASTTNSYPQSLTYTDGNGQTHEVSVSINSKTPTMSKDDYVRSLEDKGYKLTDDQKNKLSDSVDLSASTIPLVIANPNAQTSYTQTLRDDKGNNVTVHINSEKQQISSDDYKKQLAAQGVSLSEDFDKAIGNNPVDLSDENPTYTVTTSADANKAIAYPQTVNVKQEDGSYKPTTVSITSDTPTMSKDDYVKTLKALGYDVQNSENIPATVDLTNANNAYKVNQPTDAPTSYQQAVVLPDGTKAKVNINSKSSTIDKDDLAKELADQGYALSDNTDVTYPLDLTKDNSINVKPNAQAVTNYPQTVKVANEDGTFTNKTVFVPSANGTLSASEYVKAMLDNGYTVANPSALSDPLSVAFDNVNPVVIPNASAHAVKLNVKQSDGTTKEITVNVGSQNSYLNKSDFVNDVSAQGYTISDMDSLPASVDLSDGKTYDATPNASSYANTLNSSDGTKSAVVKHDTPLITKQDLINQLKDQGLNVSDTGKLNDVLNLTNSDDMKKVASLIEGFTTYKMNVGVVGTGDTISVSGNSKTISKQDFINKVEADGYKLMNPDALKDTLDLTNPDDFKGLIIAKAGNVDGNRDESNTSYSQDAKVAGSNDTVKVESQNKTMTKDEFVKYLDAKGYKPADESKLPDTIDLTKPLSDIELVSNKNQSSDNNDANNNQSSISNDASKSEASTSNDASKSEASSNNDASKSEASSNNDASKSEASSNNDASKSEASSNNDASKSEASTSNDASNSEASSNNDASKSEASSNNDASKSEASSNNDADKNQANKVYVQNVKVAGSNKTVKVESSKKTMTKAEFVKYLASKGYKVADESKLPETIDLTKSLGDINVVDKKADSKKTTKTSNKETEKNASTKEVNGHRGQVADKKEAGKLPQTGDETNQRNVFGFGLISMVLGFIMAIFGLRRKNK